MITARRHPASYRDPASTVLVAEGRILRGFRADGWARYQAVRDTGFLGELERAGLLVPGEELDVKGEAELGAFAGVVEHAALAFISHPYEWPFALLQGAALLQLEIQLRGLERRVALSDASAYNIQFRGTRPVFIDLGSFQPYREGELWGAHQQFCEHFLNPLILASEIGVDCNPWLRGSLEGIPTAALARLLPWHRRLSPRHLFHVLLPARASRVAADHERGAMERIKRAHLPIEGYRLMLIQLRNWIAKMRPAGSRTTWSGYAATRTYRDPEIERKRQLTSEFAAAHRPRMLWDLGCNDGEFSEVALGAGAATAIGFDADSGALDLACKRARNGALDFLPLFQDLAQPSPASGWRCRERESLLQRARPDAIIALAFAHHLALGRNVPLDEVVDFLVDLAPVGLIEFVPKTDPTVRRMLALKGDIFPDYDEGAFESSLARRARITRRETLSASGRRLYEFQR